MNAADNYVQTWLSSSVPTAGPDGTRLASLRDVAGGLSIFPTGRNGDGARWKDDRESLLEDPVIARLAGVTQVLSGQGNHSNRLDHSTEVAEIAADVATQLNLSTDLAAAIGLAHDCGHCPFGHAGERSFQEFRPGHEHAAWGANSVLRGRGYSDELLAGVRSHSWAGIAACTTPEAEIVRWADRIAYLTRDFVDAIDLGLVTAADACLDVVGEIGASIHEQRECLIAALVSASTRISRVSMEAPQALALAQFRQVNNDLIYQHPTVLADNVRGRHMVAIAAKTLQSQFGNWYAAGVEITSMTDANVESLVNDQGIGQTLNSSAA